jgi:pimeloyl-ACP methyl ester carboxylesterase
MKEGLFESRGLYYRTNDFRPDRQTLVFVHGVSGSSSAWAPYEARFQHDFNVLTYDLRGHGRSAKYPHSTDYAIAHFVDDLRLLLRHLAIDRCVLVSHSFATLLTLEFLRTNQSLVDSVILVSSDFDVGRRLAARILRTAIAPAVLLDRLPFRPAPGRHVDYSRYPNSGDWNLLRMREDIGNTTWRVYWFCTLASYAVHAESLLPDLRMPVLLVHGRKDTIFPVENSVYMATRIPDAELIVLDDADHIVVLNQPRELSEAIERFVERVSGAGVSAEPALLGVGHAAPRVD